MEIVAARSEASSPAQRTDTALVSYEVGHYSDSLPVMWWQNLEITRIPAYRKASNDPGD